MFLVFKDSALGDVRISLNTIATYYTRNEYVVINTTTGITLRSKEHTLEQVDHSILEGYVCIKQIPKVKENEQSSI